MGRSCIIQSPAKINLHLRIGDRRSDGFHDLESIFISLAFGDTLEFDEEEKAGPGCVIEMVQEQRPLAVLGAEENIIAKAVARFKAHTGFDRSLRIRLNKRIPIGGGLGGGSSNAASTLLALDALAGTRLSREVLGNMAEDLGSDVPFFLTGGAAWVSGRGEEVQPLSMPGSYGIVLVNPGIPSGTREAFEVLDAFRDKFPEGDRGEIPREALFSALERGPASWPYRNDFLPAFLWGGRELREEYLSILGELSALGADFRGLSGAGSTCFGIFMRQGVAEEAVRVLSGRWTFVQLTFFLARSAKAVVQLD